MNSLTKKNNFIGINLNKLNNTYKKNSFQIENKVNSLHTLSLSLSQNNIKSTDIYKNNIKGHNKYISENNINKDKAIKIIRKNKYKNKKSENKFINNKYNINFIKKLKFIQLWWKTIFQIIKIQKNIRAFLFRIKLLKYLDKSEILFNNILIFSKIINKIVCKNIFIKLVINNKMYTTITSKGSRKFINKNKKYNLEKRNDYFRDIYKSNTNKILNNSTVIHNQRNLITIINNTNNIYNNIYNKNNKFIIKKKLNIKKNKSKSIILSERNNNNKIISNLTQKKINLIYLNKYFKFWKIKNVKKLILNRLYSIYLLSKFLSKKYFIFRKEILNKIKNYSKNTKLNFNKKILIYDRYLKQNNSLRFNKSQSFKLYHNILNININLKGKENYNDKKNLSKNKTYKYSNVIRNNTNLFNIYNRYSKSSKNYYTLNLKKKYIKDNIDKNERIIKRNNNYNKSINNNYCDLNLFKNTSFNTNISNNNLNNCLIQYKNKFVYRRKKISNSKNNKNNISDKKRYNNSCESIIIKLKENKIEEKEVFFNNRIKIKKNVLNLKKVENNHNKSVVEVKDSKKNIFYHMFNDIIHSNK